MTIVRLEDVHLRFGSTPVLTGVDLDVAAGERVGIAGPNGAGKSTLLSVIATLRTPTTGTATVFDAEVGSPRAYEVRRLIGWSGHEPALFEELTLRENLHHFARLAGLDVSDADRSSSWTRRMPGWTPTPPPSSRCCAAAPSPPEGRW
jgi:ABC-2 type transport system ATP-binding protein